ncbi:MAG: ribosome biogenesis GTPase Der [Desulfobulbaceae bacterium]|jgi:GTP-binding protein|nr:ribosome biogenesis GTPase Der [Desulfobulbaceae bacterium]
MTTAPNAALPVIALIGRPNVGKSTLFNRITKSRKALVDPTPGVTRDRHYDRIEWEGRAMLVVDTGGIDDNPEDLLVGHIREQAMAAIDEADILLFILDGKDGLTAADLQIAAIVRKSEKRLFFVVNKVDSPAREEETLPAFYELGCDALWPVSAEHGYGFGDLMDAVAETAATLGAGELPPLPAGTVTVAFFGRPNVGKSSMINRILGEERMVVSEIAGTTRDAVDTLLTHGNHSYLLVDTAGIRRRGKTKEKLEKFSILKSLAALERCEVAVVMLDAGEGVTEQDSKVVGHVLERGRGLILLVNKWDLLADDKKAREKLLAEIAEALPFVGYAPLTTASALTGYGVKKLFPLIGAVHRQFTASFSTAALNRVLKEATEAHPPPIYKNKRLKFYYTAQIGQRPPKFVIMTNSGKGVHFSYQRYLTNQYRERLGLDKIALQMIFKDKSEQRGK